MGENPRDGTDAMISSRLTSLIYHACSISNDALLLLGFFETTPRAKRIQLLEEPSTISLLFITLPGPSYTFTYLSHP